MNGKKGCLGDILCTEFYPSLSTLFFQLYKLFLLVIHPFQHHLNQLVVIAPPDIPLIVRGLRPGQLWISFHRLMHLLYYATLPPKQAHKI